MSSPDWGQLLAQAMAWETDAPESGTGWVTWGVCFLLAVIGGSVSILLRSRPADSSRSTRERLSSADRLLQKQSSPASPVSEGVWIGTLEFEPRSPTDLLRLVPLRILVDDDGGARSIDGVEIGEAQRVVAVRWESSARAGDRCSTLAIELEDDGGRPHIRLTLRLESRTWVTVPGAAGPSLRLRRTADSLPRPNAA